MCPNEPLPNHDPVRTTGEQPLDLDTLVDPPTGKAESGVVDGLRPTTTRDPNSGPRMLFGVVLLCLLGFLVMAPILGVLLGPFRPEDVKAMVDPAYGSLVTLVSAAVGFYFGRQGGDR